MIIYCERGMLMFKIVIVMGFVGGLGRGIVERLCKDGFCVVLYDINDVLLYEIVLDFKEKYFYVMGVKGDVLKCND